jgi:hypothetical protein
LAADAVDIAIDICWVFVGLVIVFVSLLVYGLPTSPGAASIATNISLNVASIATCISLNVASIVLGPAIRIRGILHDLANYETVIVKLKTRLVELEG